MKLEKDGQEVELTNAVQIAAYKNSGWAVVKDTAKKGTTKEE